MAWSRFHSEEANKEDILSPQALRDSKIKRSAAALGIVLASAFIAAENRELVPLNNVANLTAQLSLVLWVVKLNRHNEALISHDNAVQQFPHTARFHYGYGEAESVEGTES